jgi:type 1 glutamine amidotransferase/sugar phosphate isomerase/epimerase
MNKRTLALVLGLITWAMTGPLDALAQRQNEPRPMSIRNNGKQTRTSVTPLLGWRVGIPAKAFADLPFLEAASKVDLVGLGYVEGYSEQQVSDEIQKKLDYNLSAQDVAAIKVRMDQYNVRMSAYHVAMIPADDASRRKLFEFAKALDVEWIVASPDPAALPALDQLASTMGVKLAVRNGSRQETPAYWNPKDAMTALQGRSENVGIYADLGRWMEEGIKPLDGLKAVGNRLLAANLRDRSALGSGGRSVTLGKGVAGVSEFLLEISRMNPPQAEKWLPDCGNCGSPRAAVKPLFLTLDATGTTETFADLWASALAFEHLVRPAMGHRVIEVSKKMPITPVSQVPPEDRQKIEAAVPRQAQVKPKRSRKLLVIDLCPTGGFYHTNIAHTNLALELMAKHTGAYEPIFDNNLENLKYPKIKEYDAVFLNSVVGEVFVDPDVMNGLMRYVREGGGVAGLHGTTYASQNIPEFGDLMGAQDGPHRVEPAMLRIDDPQSPINAAFGGEDLYEYTDEYYRFREDGPYSREKLRVLLSLHVGKTDISKGNPPYLRHDNDYGLSWIKSYGKGRVFNCALGHETTMFMTTPMAQHVLAGIQFVLGDLEADTTPNAKLAPKK